MLRWSGLFTFESVTPGRDFPGWPVVEAPPSNAGVVDLMPDRGTKVPRASWPKNQNRSKTDSIKTLKKWSTLKKKSLKK